MAILPKDHETANTLTPKDRFMNDLPIEFYRQEVLEMAKEYGLSEGMMDKLIGKMLKDGVLVKIEPGHYRFNSNYKK